MLGFYLAEGTWMHLFSKGLHLHLFDFSPVCVFKFVINLFAWWIKKSKSRFQMLGFYLAQGDAGGAWENFLPNCLIFCIIVWFCWPIVWHSAYFTQEEESGKLRVDFRGFTLPRGTLEAPGKNEGMNGQQPAGQTNAVIYTWCNTKTM